MPSFVAVNSFLLFKGSVPCCLFWGFCKAPRDNLDCNRWYINTFFSIIFVFFYNDLGTGVSLFLEFYPELILVLGWWEWTNPIFVYPYCAFWVPVCVSAHLGHATLGPRGLHVSCTPEPLGHSIKDHTRRAFYEVRLPSLHNLGVEWKNKAILFIYLFIFWGKKNWIFKHVLTSCSPWVFVRDQRQNKSKFN